MPTPPDRPKRVVASLQGLQARPRPLYRALDAIDQLPTHMTRRGVVRSFLIGGFAVACQDKGAGRDSARGGDSTAALDSAPAGDTDRGDSEGRDSEARDTDAPAPAPAHDVSVWVRIAEDDVVTIAIVKNEMGQGVATAMAQIVAEELDADWETVGFTLEPEMGDRDLDGWSDGTWGSTSITDNYDQLRAIGAAARAVLLEAAAARWGVSVDELTTEAGVVHHPTEGSLRYGELAEDASLLSIPDAADLKDPEDFAVIGQPVERLDIEAHVRGQATYGLDVVLDGMRYAAVRQSPVFGGEVANLSSLSVEGTGAEAVVSIPNGVAVVASSWWTAKSVLASLDVQFEAPPEMDGLSTAALEDQLRASLDGAGAVSTDEGDVDAALAGAAVVVEASYGAPMLAHAPMEPVNCTADVRADACTVYAPTQYAKGAQAAASQASGLPTDAITVVTTALGGAFGRKAETDFVIQAVTISQAIGAPVKVIWTREEDIQHDYYRPLVQARVRGGLDAHGQLVAWRAEAAGTSYFSAGSAWNLEGFHDLLYRAPTPRIAWAGADVGVPFGFLRAPGHNKYNFMVESFMDELAEAAGEDPLAFRLRHLADQPRAAAVLEAVRDLSGWGSPKTPGAAHGCSLLVWGRDSYIAQVAEVTVDAKRRVRARRVWAAVDIGRVINPDIARAQIEGGIIYSLSTGLYGKITLTDGAVDQSNFHDYPLLGMADAPEVITTFIDSDEAPGGVGELSAGGAISAVINAMARLAERVRSLPITEHGFS